MIDLKLGNIGSVVDYQDEEIKKLESENNRLSEELAKANARIRILTVELSHLKAKDSKINFKEYDSRRYL